MVLMASGRTHLARKWQHFAPAAKAIGSDCQAAAIIPFDRDRSVSRVLEISLVPDGSRNGSNRDRSVVVLKSPYFEIGLCSQKIAEHHTAVGCAAWPRWRYGPSYWSLIAILTSYGGCLYQFCIRVS